MNIRLGDVDTWYDEHGSGDPLVLLHPGGADSRAWEANLAPLAERFGVFTPDRRGHGRTADAGELTFDAMARDTIAFIEAVAGGPVDLAGCSDGASVGLLVAHLRPDLVKRLVFVCGVFHHKGWLPGSIELDAESDAFLGGWYAEVSPDGAEHWPVVKDKLYEEHLTEPSLTPAELARINVPTLVMIGDRDEVKIEHAVELFRCLPDARLAIVPGTSHGLLVEKPDLCNAMVLDFLG
jgi:pimeloyl-ACP methyl ester carboxylesterase